MEWKHSLQPQIAFYHFSQWFKTELHVSFLFLSLYGFHIRISTCFQLPVANVSTEYYGQEDDRDSTNQLEIPFAHEGIWSENVLQFLSEDVKTSITTNMHENNIASRRRSITWSLQQTFVFISVFLCLLNLNLNFLLWPPGLALKFHS